MKTITLCGSMQFFSEMQELKKNLEILGYTVYLPSDEGIDLDYTQLPKEKQIDLKRHFIDTHLEKIKKSEAILIANYTKNSIEGYIGANTFLEIASAYILQKKIFLLHPISNQANSLELEALQPVILNGELKGLQQNI